MTDELRNQPSVDASSGSRAPAPARRRYVRPELTEFGSVHELTRGASGNAKDGNKRRKAGNG